ncbi:thioredoxin family protein [Sphingobium sufflavum]|uniref:thioredoxin family protein n=1 Tax=Sphingobium sufflavum TaxID=1129547 RepID=UPI001F2DD3A1|nr:thioredoxin family protein [Sphingobium sufflavum]MCE7795398.1 thioredoxin family protein [Sphingobium sufflavum]
MNRSILSLALAVLPFLAIGAEAGAVPAPRVSVTSLDALPQPLPLPYDEKADADRQVAAAKAKAKAQGKKLLIDLGGNWCPDCRVLAGVLELREVKAFLARHYVVVTVDVGRLDKNLQIARRYGVPAVKGVPAVLVVDPKTDKLLNEGRLFALSDARHMTPQALADWLAQWI